MILRVYSDASYLNRPNSGSTAGGYHYLGTTDSAFHNGPVFCQSGEVARILRQRTRPRQQEKIVALTRRALRW